MANKTVYPFGPGRPLPAGYPIADDLNTDSAQVALSARQGKIIGDELFTPQEIDVSSLTELNWLISTANTWNSTSGAGKCSLIPVIPGRTYRIVNDNANEANTVVAPLKQSSPGPNNGDSVQFATGFSARIVVYYGTQIEITMPSDAVMLYVYREQSNGTDCTPSVYEINSSENLSLRKLSFPFNVPGWNARATGIVTYSQNYRTTGLIKIDDKAVYEIRGIFGSSAGLCVFYDENKDYLDYFDETGLTSPAKVTLSKKDGSIPSDAAYMRVQGSLAGCYCVALGGKEEEEKGWTELPMTLLVNMTTNVDGLYQDSTTRVSVASTYAVPNNGATLKFKLPPFICCWIYSGYNTSGNAISFGSSNGWFLDGDEFTLPARDMYFRFVFGFRNHMPVQSGDTSFDLSVQDINDYIAAGELKIFYKESEDVVLANTDCEKYVRAAMRKFTNVRADDADLDVLPKFIHTSDTHGDVIRTNRFMDYADAVGVDAALISGDMAAYRGRDRVYYVNTLDGRHKTPTFTCMGNHDSGKFGDFATAQEQYNSVMKVLMDRNEVETNPEEDYPTYYYKDFTSKKIRLIVLNSYEEGRKYATSTNCYYSKKQIDWLIDTLASTPQNYGVVLMYHSPESAIQKDVNRAAFYQDSVATDYQSDSITGGPIVKIIDAFITKSAISDSFTETNNSSQTVTVSYSADFSSINSGVEFIAHICGHEHCDFVGYYANGSSRQLVLNVTCGCCLYGADYLGLAHLSDLPRGGVGVTQDSFNVYAIDRARGIVKVARVGSNTNFNGEERKFAIMPYKD